MGQVHSEPSEDVLGLQLAIPLPPPKLDLEGADLLLCVVVLLAGLVVFLAGCDVLQTESLHSLG